MKLNFILPGDKITLLSDGRVASNEKILFPSATNYFDATGFVPKGTELVVSQVYIRKGGWYESSLTFKVKNKELHKTIKEMDEDSNKRLQEKHLSERVEDYNNNFANIDVMNKEELNTLCQKYFFNGYGSSNIFYPVANPTEKFFVWKSRSYDPNNVAIMKPGINIEELKSEIKRSWELHLVFLKRNSYYKSPNVGSMVFRVLLTDIETWDVDYKRAEPKTKI